MQYDKNKAAYDLALEYTKMFMHEQYKSEASREYFNLDYVTGNLNPSARVFTHALEYLLQALPNPDTQID